MPVSKFRQTLRTKGLGPGANWLKADFHVHLPTSHDYEYKGDDDFEFLGKALESAGLSFVILLKHQTFATKAELAKLQPYCPSVTLIPGVEIDEKMICGRYSATCYGCSNVFEQNFN
jgi:hypothetical protein